MTLTALEFQEGIAPVDYEVIVVDDDSSDDIVAIIESSRKRAPYDLKIVTCKSGGARGVPRNRGIDVARGDLILFIDADALPGRRLLDAHRDAHATNYQLCLGDIYVLPETEFLADPADGTPFPGCHPQNPLLLPVDCDGLREDELLVHAKKGAYPGHSRWHRQLEEILMEEDDVPFKWVGAIPHNLSISRETLTRVGFFDTLLKHMEGWDFGIRALRLGCVLGFAEKARTFHLFHRREQVDMMRNTREAQALLMQRYPDALTDLVQLWFHSAVGDVYLPAELNLGNWRAISKIMSNPTKLAECQRLYRLWCRLKEPPSAMDYRLGAALNSSFSMGTHASHYPPI